MKADHSVHHWASPVLSTHSQAEPLGGVPRSDAGASELAPYILLTTIPIAAAVALAAVYQYVQQRRGMMNSPELLFRELCRIHGIRWREERLLRKIALAANLMDPAEILVLPDRFEAAVKTAASKLGGPEIESADELRQRLFPGDTAPAGPIATSSSCPSLRSLPS